MPTYLCFYQPHLSSPHSRADGRPTDRPPCLTDCLAGPLSRATASSSPDLVAVQTLDLSQPPYDTFMAPPCRRQKTPRHRAALSRDRRLPLGVLHAATCLARALTHSPLPPVHFRPTTSQTPPRQLRACISPRSGLSGAPRGSQVAPPPPLLMIMLYTSPGVLTLHSWPG